MPEPDAANKKFQKELNSGTAALVLLAVLERAREPMYGYQIAKLIETSREEVPVKQGALYPVLRSLETGGLLESRVEPSVQGPPRRYYAITDPGRAVLRRWIEIWNQTKTFVDSAVKGDHNG
ncbi:MAG: PadR family transcriptional regulator [Candidatus Zixiibacteriota bacterium]|nr:MAG: PadR family transcriptional regulator [candidate division Zixibacteria bacterium]